ncbi:MAG: hypothetical protein IJO94_03980 [Firmicutes bacterium]|nr:hypothetical protein [Bacillota bacterium]
MKETKTISYQGQCPLFKVKRGVEILVANDNGTSVPVENQCEMEDDCHYWVGCPVFETCKKESLVW